MNNTTNTTIRLSITNEVRKALVVAKKRYPTLSDPEILKLGLAKIVTEYAEDKTSTEERSDIRKTASAAVGGDYLNDDDEDIYTTGMGKKVRFS